MCYMLHVTTDAGESQEAQEATKSPKKRSTKPQSYDNQHHSCYVESSDVAKKGGGKAAMVALGLEPKDMSPFPNPQFHGEEKEGTSEAGEAAASTLARQHTHAFCVARQQSSQPPAPNTTAPRRSLQKQPSVKNLGSSHNLCRENVTAAATEVSISTIGCQSLASSPTKAPSSTEGNITPNKSPSQSSEPFSWLAQFSKNRLLTFLSSTCLYSEKKKVGLQEVQYVPNKSTINGNR